ncbi:hypothetical protein KOR42_02050 [Thalassoglobus neptunius]|uniref:Uncharacterized protein n=1 Tax=Thalassoglobus neptunius TaxID=1938619 RepID=A0A5C5X1Z8_9PLAN|nr:hypothetical protein [Thalassoglobus neptunius]TWT56850.1 hypothetical protein KOR42_02050 [Thalassoglobus neptunius]
MKIDDVVIQRCLDGELSEPEQIELIRQLDAAPNQSGWRKLAIEYLENQLFRTALQQRSEQPIAQGTKSVAPEFSPEATSASPSPEATKINSSEQSRSSTSGLHRILPLVAASLMIGLFSGGFGVHLASNSSPSIQAVDPSQPRGTFDLGAIKDGIESGAIAVGTGHPLRNGGWGLNQGAGRNELPPGQVPSGVPDFTHLVKNQNEPSPNRSLVPFTNQDVPLDWREQMERSGYELKRSPQRSFRVNLGNGRQAIIPGHNVQVVPAVQ